MSRSLTTSRHLYANRSLSATTPFPNLLLDEAMPHLKDTEWRVLCVIVRQTLGWQDKNSKNRKASDWLTQAQLVKKTGRDRAALSRAINALVSTRFIEVRNEQGDVLSSPAERRHCKGRLFFALHPRFFADTATTSHSAQSEYHRASKANTTKETRTKENDTKGSKTNLMSVQALEVFGDRGSQPQGTSQTVLPTEDHAYSHAAQKFIALFQQYHAQMKMSEVNMCLTVDEVARLEKLLALHCSIDWKLILQAFFDSEADYIRRHNHSLRAFLDTCNIFLLRGSHAFGHAPGRQARRQAIARKAITQS